MEFPINPENINVPYDTYQGRPTGGRPSGLAQDQEVLGPAESSAWADASFLITSTVES